MRVKECTPCPAPDGSREVTSYRLRGLDLKANMVIKYYTRSPPAEERFFYIRAVLRSKGIVLRGWPMRKSSTIFDDIHIFMQLSSNQLESPITTLNCSLRVPSSAEHVSLIFTNAPPCKRPRGPVPGQLVCRWLHLERRQATGSGSVWRLLRSTECPGFRAVTDHSLRTDWRRFKQSSVPVIPNNGHIQYTVADVCAGGGGCTRGMQQAGLKIVLALDQDKAACATLRANLDLRIIYVEETDIHSFLLRYRGIECKLNILHLSFPCQAYSPANARGGRNDETNIATGFCVTELLALCRPRVVTLEQTAGITFTRWMEYRDWFIRQFTEVGYSVRAGNYNLATYGNAQPRRRFIMIATCPGEPLYPMPPATHGADRQAVPTITDVLDGLDYMTIPEHMKWSIARNADPYDASHMLYQCITTTGGDGNLHPSGTRTFNLQELAALQAFPQSHQFKGTSREILKQIANAVPPVFAKHLFEHLVECMRKEDADTKSLKRGHAHGKALLKKDEDIMMIED